MKVRNTLLQIIGTAALLAAPAAAQTSLNVEATMPFSFQAGDVRFPSGDYVVSSNAGTPVLCFKNVETRKAQCILTTAPIRSGDPDNALLRFRVYGDKHYFASMWSPSQGGGVEVSRSKAEKEAASAGVPFKVAILKIEHR